MRLTDEGDEIGGHSGAASGHDEVAAAAALGRAILGHFLRATKTSSTQPAFIFTQRVQAKQGCCSTRQVMERTRMAKVSSRQCGYCVESSVRVGCQAAPQDDTANEPSPSSKAIERETQE